MELAHTRALDEHLQLKAVLPKDPKIYHITHLDNLPRIVESNFFRV